MQLRDRPRLLVVDHNACRRPQQEPYRLLASKHGFQVTLVVPSAWREPFGLSKFEKGEETPGFEIRPLRPVFNGRYHRVLYPGLAREMARAKPQQLWVHAEPENFLAWQAGRARDKACPRAQLWLVSWRNIAYARGGLPMRLPWLHQRIEDASKVAAHGVFCYNREAVAQMNALGFQTKPIHMGVNLAYFKPGPKAAARRAAGLPDQARVLGFVGRCLEEKGVTDLIRAAAGLPRSLVWVIGAGPALESWIALARELKVVLRHRVAGHEQVPALLRAMDVLALPSRSTAGWKEQFGRVLIEAMACGVPVVGSDSGAIPWVIGPAGWTFREGDSASLAQALRAALAPSGQAKARRAGPKRAQQFGWDAVAGGMAQAFQAAQPSAPQEVAVQGAAVFSGDQGQALAQVGKLLDAGRGGTVLYFNAHLANLAADDSALRRALREADLVLPDGGGIVLAARWAGRGALTQLALGDLLGPLAGLAQARKVGVYFWGGEAGVASRAAQALGVKLAGLSHGFQPDEASVAAVIGAIRRSRARLVFIGQGSPRQEQLAQRVRLALPGAVIVVCGNAFTFAAGLQSRAPRWMRRLAMEWLWRFAQEPRRLWRRYLLGNLRFLLRALRA